MTFQSLYNKRRCGEDIAKGTRLLALDPGETTGWAFFVDGELTKWGQAPTKLEGWSAIEEVFGALKPTHVVAENYRVYEHKLKQHANSEVYTLRLIGVIDYICFKRNIPITYQMAQSAKGFCTDSKLKTWGYWKEGMKHARDAVRHGCYYLLFNK